MKGSPVVVISLALVILVLFSGCTQPTSPAKSQTPPALTTVPTGTPASSPQPTVAGVISPDLKPVASFEGGQWYKAGPYDVIVLSGSYREMGKQYGGLMKDELSAEYAFLINTLTQRGYTKGQVLAIAKGDNSGRPQFLEEITAGMSETSGLTSDDLAILYDGGILYMYYNGPTKSSCSFLATWGDYTKDGSVIVSRNLDLMDSMSAFNPYYVLAVYRPNDGSRGVATFGPVGMRPETLMNSAGLFIADDAVIFPYPNQSDNSRPPLVAEFFRMMLSDSTTSGLDADILATRPDTAYIVDAAGPDQAYVYEETIADTKQRTGTGLIAASNHFIDPAWHLSGKPDDGNSVARYNSLVSAAEKSKGSIDAATMMQIRDVLYRNGGATFLRDDLGGEKYSTIHQVVFVPKTRTLWMKVMGNNWQQVELSPLFGT